MVQEKLLKKELQETREDLAELERYVEDFSTFLPLPVATINPTGIIVDINKAFEEITGYKPIEIVGEPIEVIFFEKEKIKEIGKEIRRKRTTSKKELTLVSKKGKKFLVEVSIAPRKDEKGTFIGYFMGITDITELKKLQLELEEKVRERTRELQEKIEELEKFQRITVGRELKMIALKREIEKLKEELKKYKPA